MLQEIGSAAYECPDVIGWRWGESSTLIECKVSVEDFRRDSSKVFRRNPEMGMGNHRWYAFPEGFVESYPRAQGTPPYIHTLCPRGWGIVEFGTRRAKVILEPVAFGEKRNVRNETRLLVSSLRRATEGWGRKVFGEIAPPMVDGDPGPTAARVIRDLRNENRRLRNRIRLIESQRPESTTIPTDDEIAQWLEKNGHHFTT